MYKVTLIAVALFSVVVAKDYCGDVIVTRERFCVDDYWRVIRKQKCKVEIDRETKEARFISRATTNFADYVQAIVDGDTLLVKFNNRNKIQEEYNREYSRLYRMLFKKD